MIPAGKKVIADEGYRGEAQMITTHNRFDSTAVKNSRGGLPHQGRKLSTRG
jgi:hypothetical protein